MSEATKEIMWAPDLFKELGIEYKQPATMYEDNSSAVALAKTENCTKLNHLASKYHLVRQQVMKNKIRLVWISTHIQPSDVLTKPQPRVKFEEFRKSMLTEIETMTDSPKQKIKDKSENNAKRSKVDQQ